MNGSRFVALATRYVYAAYRFGLLSFGLVFRIGLVWFCGAWILVGVLHPAFSFSVHFPFDLHSPFSTFNWHTEVEDGNRIGIETADSPAAPLFSAFPPQRLHRPLSVLISRLGP